MVRWRRPIYERNPMRHVRRTSSCRPRLGLEAKSMAESLLGTKPAIAFGGPGWSLCMASQRDIALRDIAPMHVARALDFSVGSVTPPSATRHAYLSDGKVRAFIVSYRVTTSLARRICWCPCILMCPNN
jgi:hypothetical protein